MKRAAEDPSEDEPLVKKQRKNEHQRLVDLLNDKEVSFVSNLIQRHACTFEEIQSDTRRLFTAQRQVLEKNVEIIEKHNSLTNDHNNLVNDHNTLGKDHKELSRIHNNLADMVIKHKVKRKEHAAWCHNEHKQADRILSTLSHLSVDVSKENTKLSVQVAAIEVQVTAMEENHNNKMTEIKEDYNKKLDEIQETHKQENQQLKDRIFELEEKWKDMMEMITYSSEFAIKED